MPSPLEPESREHGEWVPGPPWILGHRGAPREAPENTLASLRLALELGLDGVEYDLHACASGEPVLLHDETLDRTTDLHGPVSAAPLSELVHADAGGWFRKRFAGEPVPMLEEALELEGGSLVPPGPPRLFHMIELKDPRLVPRVAGALARLARPVPFRIASFHRNVCLEARDAGLPTMLLADEANENDRRFVRDERIQAYGTAPFGWNDEAGRAEWSCERWSWSVDEPRDLLEACRRPLFGFNTNEPRRALAIRALVHLTPGDEGAYPLDVPALEVEESLDSARAHGEWSGHWEVQLGLRNPFPFPVQVALGFQARGGAFRVSGLPETRSLDAHAATRLPLVLEGGSWSPGEDPTVAARFSWREGRAQWALVLDAPLPRVRTLRLGEGTRRLRMLAERPAEPAASMTLRLRGGELLAAVEDPGGLSEVRACLRLGASVRRGGRGVRMRLPEAREPEGIPFCAGFEGIEPETGAHRLRRFAGGLPYGLGAGAPARLLLGARA